MPNTFLTNYTETTFLDKIKDTDRLYYKAKYLQPDLFQRECEVNISDK